MIRRRRSRALKPIAPWQGPKPKLPMQVTYRCRVHFQDLQEYLATVYKMRDYDVKTATGATVECGPEFIVTNEMPAAANWAQQVDDIRRGRRTRNLGLILNVLCLDGFIPAGVYSIDMRPVPCPIIAYTKLLHKHKDPTHHACMAFKKAHPDTAFTRRARTLDKLVLLKEDDDE
jgi:hypothetical protein